MCTLPIDFTNSPFIFHDTVSDPLTGLITEHVTLYCVSTTGPLVGKVAMVTGGLGKPISFITV